MDKCSEGQSYLTVDKHGNVGLHSLRSLASLAQADWKSINPPPNVNHRSFRFWQSRSTGKCLTVLGGKSEKRVVGVADCKFDGSNPFQLFAFRFHYHKAFCCCNVHNEWSCDCIRASFVTESRSCFFNLSLRRIILPLAIKIWLVST